MRGRDAPLHKTAGRVRGSAAVAAGLKGPACSARRIKGETIRVYGIRPVIARGRSAAYERDWCPIRSSWSRTPTNTLDAPPAKMGNPTFHRSTSCENTAQPVSVRPQSEAINPKASIPQFHSSGIPLDPSEPPAGEGDTGTRPLLPVTFGSATVELVPAAEPSTIEGRPMRQRPILRPKCERSCSTSQPSYSESSPAFSPGRISLDAGVIMSDSTRYTF